MMQTLVSFVVVIGLGLIGGADLPAQQRIAVSYPGIAGYNIPFWVALDGGEFKKAGLDVDAVLISGGSKSMQALLSGGLDFAHVSGGVSVQANLNGADVTIIGTGSNSMSAGVVAAKDIKSYQDLRGKKSVSPASAATMISASASLSKKMASIPTRT